MVREDSCWIGVNTSLTNKLVAEAICNGQIAEMKDVKNVRHEVKISKETRLDLEIDCDLGKVMVEVKNCSLVEDGCAMFPDAVTVRGAKHLRELIRLKLAGTEACIFFLVQRMDAEYFSPAAHIDREYAATLKRAKDAGVITLAYQAEVQPTGISVCRSLPVVL